MGKHLCLSLFLMKLEVFKDLVCDMCNKSATQVWQKCYTNGTSATQVLHERHKCDTSEEFWFW